MNMMKLASITNTATMSGPRRQRYLWKKYATGKVAMRMPPEYANSR